MKLIRCYVAGFGKLQDFSYDFSEGINTLHRENGWGKTTFSVFIKSMFYGLQNSTKKSVAENERKHYFPWNQSRFGGYIDFEVGKKAYRVERYFGKKEKEDTFSLYDLATLLPSEDYSENIGEELFQIDVTSYERSTYIPQNTIAIEMTDSINAKLSNLVECGNDINNFDAAYARLENRLKNYKKTGGRGLLAQLQTQISAKQEEIEECVNKEEGIRKIQAQILQAKQERQEYARKKKAIRVVADNRKLAGEKIAIEEHFNSISKRKAEIIDKITPIRSIFATANIDESEILDIKAEAVTLESRKDSCRNMGLSDEEKKSLQELTEFFAEGCPDAPEMEMHLGEAKQYDGLREELIRLQERRDYLIQAREEKAMQMREEQRKKQEEQRQTYESAIRKTDSLKKVMVTILVLSLVLILLGAMGVGPLLFIGLPAAIVSVLILIFVKPKQPPENEADFYAGTGEPEISEEELALEKQYQQLQEAKEAAEAHYASFVEQFPIENREETPIQVLTRLDGRAKEFRKLSQMERELEEKRREELDRIQSKEREIRKRLLAISDVYGNQESLLDASTQLSADWERYQLLLQDLEMAHKEMEEFATNNSDKGFVFAYNENGTVCGMHREEETTSDASDVLSTIEDSKLSDEELFSQENELTEQMEELDQKIHSYEKDIEALSVITDRHGEYEEELDHLYEQMREAEYQAGVIEKTMQYLKDAKEAFSTHYMGAMKKGFTKYMQLFGEENRDSIHLDVRLDAKQESFGSLWGKEYFSAGYRDFIGICIRLALVDALFEHEKPFVILDDPFVNLDDAKVEKAKQLLLTLGGEYQVIYLLCHSSRELA